MKSVIFSIFSFLVIMAFMPWSLKAQHGMLTSEEELIGEASEFFIGLHTGIFDCNQSVKYPFNIGMVAQYNYLPDVSGKWFFGAELGAFYTASGEDKLNRRTKLGLVDISIYPGISFPVNANITSDDNNILRRKKLAQARKLRFALGFVVAIPVKKASEGPGVNLDAIKPGLGLTLRSSYDLPNRLTLFLNITRIGRDLDGYAYKSPVSNERSNGNKHDLSYYYKLGVLWNFFRK